MPWVTGLPPSVPSVYHEATHGPTLATGYALESNVNSNMDNIKYGGGEYKYKVFVCNQI